MELAERFAAADSDEITVGGRTVRMDYLIEVDAGAEISVRFISSKADPVQGVCLELAAGQLDLSGVKHAGMVLWADVAPKQVTLSVEHSGSTVLKVWNCWRGKFGERASWLVNAGLICEVQDEQLRFRCSDGPGPVDFAALVFDLVVGGA